MFRLTLLFIFGLVTYANSGTVSSGAKIVGGSAALIENYKYIVSLQTTGHFCGGSIYNSRYIITAAHCVRAVSSVTDIKIRYGSSYYAKGGTLVGIINGTIHPDYNPDTMENDIAILKTAERILWNQTVSAIAFARSQPKDNVTAQIAGWGTMQHGNTSIPSQLQAANVSIITPEVCNSTAYGYKSLIKKTMLCAAATGIDSCQGDSGGPLVFNNTQVGVVSWGSGCADAKYPGVYASVPVLYDFLNKTVNTLL